MKRHRANGSAGFDRKNDVWHNGFVVTLQKVCLHLECCEVKPNAQMKDIETYEEVEQLVSKFYEKLVKDPITAPKFTHLNLSEHLPRITDFWAFILIDKPGYTGNVFDRHVHLNLEPRHFEAWVEYWVNTVNELYEGPKATLAMQRAQLLSYTFQNKLFEQGNSKKIM